MPRFQLAQLNLAHMKYLMDDPAMADFVARLEEINTLADQAPGFVWRLQGEKETTAAMDVFGADMLVNMSVWQDIDSLYDYVYRSTHNQVMALRKQWFERMEEAYSVLWWVEAGHLPGPREASERLDHLRTNDASAFAFNFKNPFAPQ